MAELREAEALRNMYFNQLKDIYDLGVDAETNSTLQSRFIRRCRHVREIVENFRNTHASVLAIVAAATQPDFATHELVRQTFDKRYYDIDEKFIEWCPPDPVPQVQAAQNLNPTGISNTASGIRLPKLSLRVFDGTFTQWSPFIQSFNSAIHNNNSLTKLDKFQYLTASLSKEPLNLIKSLTLSEQNYDIAYQTVVDRYDDKRKLASQYWAVISKLAPIKTESVKDLRSLLDRFRESRAALKALSINNLEDFLWFSLLVDKLDSQTRRQFETDCRELKDEIPTCTRLEEFIESQCRILESVSNAKDITIKSSRKNEHDETAKSSSTSSKTSMVAKTVSKTPTKCPVCSDDHVIYACSEFQSKTPSERHSIIKRSRLCYNCLRASHPAPSCPSKNRCNKCQGRHHSLLHFDSAPKSPNSPSEETSEDPVTACTSQSRANVSQVLLATVSLCISDKFGNFLKARALIDSGSQASFVTTNFAKKLGLSRSHFSAPISGLGNSVSQSRGSMSCTVRPVDMANPELTVDLIVLDTLCSSIPNFPIDSSTFEHLNDLKLADESWNKPTSIDVLLGADVYPSVILTGIVSVGRSQPMAINTIFGWAIVGPAGTPLHSHVQSMTVVVDHSLEQILPRFWEIEESPTPNSPFRSESEVKAESLFHDGLSRQSDGRFQVRLPFRDVVPSFDESRAIADRRWLSLERRLLERPILRSMYMEFMEDYLESGHMSLVTSSVNDPDSYYIPHHGVFKSHSDQNKIRVVFDASAKAANGVSLNDTQLVGPKLQLDIVALLLRFRSFSFVFTCDIRQMYRQILVDPDHRCYQLIRFRFSPEQPIQTYQLETITYGVASSPFLAIRTLLELAKENCEQLPLASTAVNTSLYVDDFACGADTLYEANILKTQLVQLMELGCFELRKWASNDDTLLDDIPNDHRQTSGTFFDQDNCTIKVLGLWWDSMSDSFSFEIINEDRPCTKRNMLSEIARIYDPLGFLAPVTFMVKHLIQRLWCSHIDWDETPADDIRELWRRFKETISQLASLKIPRQLFENDKTNVQLHAFCDASERGYAAILYFRYLVNGDPQVKIVMARSKVAPLKTKSIPRLELCGAVLLTDLVTFVLENLKDVFHVPVVFAWTDSMVVLSWLAAPAGRWKVFVANRVGHIQEKLPFSHWRHVRSQDNPADLATRGLLPEELVKASLWWDGPHWLREPEDAWLNAELHTESSNLVDTECTIMEERHLVNMVVQSEQTNCIEQILERCSKFRTAVHVLAYCLRVCQLLRDPKRQVTLSISPQEFHESVALFVKCTQKKHFSQEIRDIKRKKLPRRPFRSLNLFLDKDGLLRVGGRLAHSDLSYDAKYPLLLPQHSRLTDLIITDFHTRLNHPGLNTLHFLLRQHYWILNARRSIRSCLKSCRSCWRTRPVFVNPPMGNLPRSRISELKAFKLVGVDYGGPFLVTMSKNRGVRSTKAYICVFVCYTTKAIHIELASDLSTDAFLAAFRRFIARRGKCLKVHSDCGTNFVGAARQLGEIMKAVVEAECIEWDFNPPSAPHFGGLWEAGIKSVKTHIHRVVGNQILTYEELNTVLVQIESLLNSRPLCALSSDPNDLSVLTPGHFLTLEPLSVLPAPNDEIPPVNRLKRWELIQHLHRDFWRRWHTEYLHGLQQRPKWHAAPAPFDVGTLVLIKEDNVPPMKWHLGRVVEVHPGPDQIVRVVSVKTARGIIKRPVVKLAALPVE